MIRNDLRPIENDQQFERFCCEVAKEVFGDYTAQRYGRSGQHQGGIDVRAVNRRAGRESVVVQCKFKAPRTMPSVAKIGTEFRNEFASAVANHKFDEFVFAGTWLRDTKLQDIADELSAESGKQVTVWSSEDLVDYANTYARLQRLFVQGHAAYGVDLIDEDFVKDVDVDTVDPFSFYAGLSENRLQWTGVVRGYDAPRSCRAAIDRRIDELFAKPARNSKIAAVVHGEGGSGKSTILRRIAVDRAASSDCICWWIESLEQFLSYDSISIQECPQSQHLLFIDDWYRNVSADGFAEFLIWLQAQPHVLVVIGDRDPTNRPYLSHVYGVSDALHELRPSENRAVLEQVLTTVKGGTYFEELLQINTQLVEHAPLFAVLFVLSHAGIKGNDGFSLDMNDGIETAFQIIIAKKLQQLELSERFPGYGRAVALLGHLYSAQQSDYQHFDEGFLTHTAHFFANSTINIASEGPDWRYPDALAALMHRSFGRRGERQCKFNHDIIAERGVVNAAVHAPELRIDLEPQSDELQDLLEFLISNKSASGAAVLWSWLESNESFSSESESLERVIAILRLFAESSVFPNLAMVLSSFRSPELEQRFCDVLLNDVALLVRLGPGICTVLKKPGSQLAAKVAARKILATEDLIATPHEIVSTALKMLAGERVAKTAARKILKTEDFVALPFQIVSTALSTLTGEEVANKAARTILATENFVTLPADIVSTALKTLAGEELAKTAARTILVTEGFVTLPSDIVSTALKSLAGEEVAKTAARMILATEDFVALPADMVSTAFKTLAGEELAKVAARRILTTEDFVALPFQIVSAAFKTLAGEVAAKVAARTTLATEDFVFLPQEIVSTALKTLTGEEVAKAAARTILANEDFVALPSDIVSTALKTLAGEEVSKMAARTILANEDCVALRPEIVSTALSMLADAEVAKSAARRMLSQASQINTFLQFNALRILAQADDEPSRSIAEACVSRACVPPFKGKGGFRLWHDLQFLPFAHVAAHRRLTLKVIATYSPEANIKIKQDVYKIFRCRIAYGPQPEIAAAVDDLCKRVADSCVEDLAFQWGDQRKSAQLGHIAASLELLRPSDTFDQAVQRLQDYGASNPEVGESREFQNLMARALSEMDESTQEL